MNKEVLGNLSRMGGTIAPTGEKIVKGGPPHRSCSLFPVKCCFRQEEDIADEIHLIHTKGADGDRNHQSH